MVRGLIGYPDVLEVLEGLRFAVKEARRRDRLSLRAAEDLTGVSFNAIKRFEDGGDIPLTSAIKLIRGLGRPLGGEHLAATLEAALATPTPPVTGGDEQLRLQLEAANSRAELLDEEVDDANQRLARVLAAAGVELVDEGDIDIQVQGAITAIQELHAALATAQQARDTATNQARVYQTDLAEALEQKHKATFDHETAHQAAVRLAELLGRLVDAVNEEWHPDRDHEAQVERAVALCRAAADQLNTRHTAGEHIHRYTVRGNGRYGPCDCGKRFPKLPQSTVDNPHRTVDNHRKPRTARARKGAA